jgi:hypothetical protein
LPAVPAGVGNRRSQHIEPSEVIERLEQRLAAATGRSEQIVNGIRLANMSKRMRKLRLKRNEMLGAQLFRDPAWDMLLDLFRLA